MQPRLLTASELADYLSVSTATIRRMAKRGDLPNPVRLPGVDRDLWDSSTIDRFVDGLGPTPRYDDPDEALARGGRHA